MTPATIKRLKLILKIIVSAAILAILAFRMDAAHIAAALDRFDPVLWAAAALCVAVQAFLLGWRWKILVNIGQRRLTLSQSTILTFTSQLANLVFITSIGGIIAKATLTAQAGASARKCVTASVVDRMMTLAAIAAVAGLTVTAFARSFPAIVPPGMAPLIGAGLIGSIGLLPLVSLCLFRQLRWPSQNIYLRYARRYFLTLFARQGNFVRTLLLSIAAQTMFFCSVLLLTHDAGENLDMLVVFSTLPVIALVSSLPVSFGGWGLREGAFVYGYGLLGIPMETAFFISVQVGLMGTVMSTALGVPSLLLMRSGQRRA